MEREVLKMALIVEHGNKIVSLINNYKISKCINNLIEFVVHFNDESIIK